MAFLLTQAVEVPLYAFGLRRHGLARAALVGAVATSLTHPLLWWVWPRFIPAGWPLAIGGELVTVGLEAGVLLLARLRPALAWVLVANAASVIVGWAVVRL